MHKSLLSLSVIGVLSSGLFADTATEIEQLKAKIAALEEKTDTLVDETSDLKTGFSYMTVDTEQTHSGLGSAASKVYYSKSPLSIGGYGEMYYANPDNGDAFADVYRFIPYIGYKFSDNIILNTELEFEHGGEKVVIEFMYLDFLIDKAFNVRVGHLLVPMGLTNLRHEPTLFNTVQRPELERYLIPSTWHENGVMAYGEIGDSGFEYSAGIVNALQLNNSSNDASSSKYTQWIRKGRIGASEKGSMNRVAAVGRLDYTGVNGLLAGVSAYYGDAAQGNPSGSTALIYDAHALYSRDGFKVKGVYTATSVDGADKWAEPTAATDAGGFYVNAEYNLLQMASTPKRLPLFIQHESYDPTEKCADGVDRENGLTVTTAGLNYFPDEQVVLKLDYAMKDYKNSAKEDFNTVSFGIGFIF